MKKYVTFLWDCFRLSFVGDWRYHLWMTVLTLVALSGLHAYCHQFVHGLVTTGMTDQVSWGLYIANFTYLVGLAAAAAMLVIPVDVYRNLHLHDVVVFGELLAVAAIAMCLLFVMADLGRPDRFMHLLWRFNFPLSMLTWDVLALNGYLLLNLHICGYLIYCAYRGQSPSKAFYVPFVFIAIVWAAFLARQRPVSTIAKPACMNITRKPASKVHTMLIEIKLWAMRSYRSALVSLPGTSFPFSGVPSPPGLAQTPAAAPVGSGQVGLFGSRLVPEK